LVLFLGEKEALHFGHRRFYVSELDAEVRLRQITTLKLVKSEEQVFPVGEVPLFPSPPIIWSQERLASADGILGHPLVDVLALQEKHHCVVQQEQHIQPGWRSVASSCVQHFYHPLQSRIAFDLSIGVTHDCDKEIDLIITYYYYHYLLAFVETQLLLGALFV
jgi:hypothetical protein